MKRAVLLLVMLLLAGCATTGESIPCISQRLAPVAIEGRVYFVPSRCVAWEIGPTREQREAFDKRQTGWGSQ